MQFTDADIAHLATLVRLSPTPEQRRTYAEQLSRVLEYVDQMNASGVAAPAEGARASVTPYDLREDRVHSHDGMNLTRQAPSREGAYIVSPPTT